MKILEGLNSVALSHNIDFILIGGHAVNFHGVSRTTGDLDIAINTEDSEVWTNSLLKAGYELYREQSAFIQFKSNKLEFWPVDIMKLDKNTFDQVLKDSIQQEYADVMLKIVSLRHLFSMKLHALKENFKNRSKDIDDIVELSVLKAIDLTSQDFRQTCQKFATIEVYEEIKKRYISKTT